MLGIFRKERSATSYSTATAPTRSRSLKITVKQITAHALPWMSILLVAALIIIPFSILLWLFFFTSLFTIQAVTVVDARPHITEAAKEIVDERIKSAPFNKNIFFIDTAAIENELTTKLPEIRTTRVTRQLPGTIKVVVLEKLPVLLFLSSTQYYFVDEQGIAYEKARLETLPGEVLPIVKNDDQEGKVTVGVPAVSNSFVEFVQFMQKELPEKINTKVAEIRIPSVSAREVHFLLVNNWELRFDSTREPAHQLAILEQLLRTTITPAEQSKLEYIDLRIPDRVYYKTRDSIATPAPKN